MFAVRDPWGVRPLHIGRLNGSHLVASETCAFDIVNAKLVREVKPGEIVAIDHRGCTRWPNCRAQPKAHCVFEYVYFARPDSHIFGKSVYEVRRELGRQLAREAPAKADIVVAVPDSASVAAMGYAEESGLPLEMGLIRSHYKGRTFIEPKQSIRDFGARMKYAAVVEALEGKTRGLGGRFHRAGHHQPQTDPHVETGGRQRNPHAHQFAAHAGAVFLRDRHAGIRAN
jgi:amidophosphoribosyltransferase